MSLLSMFTRKKPAEDSQPASSGFVRPVPAGPAPRRATEMPEVPSRRTERAARRELLFTVVRECMNRAGVLSASYKFKVLSLDARGRQFLVMVEASSAQLRPAERLAQIETMVAQAALAQHGIAVKGVYWRQNDHVEAVVAAAVPEIAKAASAPVDQPAVAAAAPSAPAGAAHEPISADEVAAFRKAIASGIKPPREARPTPAPQSYTLLTGFEQTEIREDRPVDLLSGSQYGDLR